MRFVEIAGVQWVLELEWRRGKNRRQLVKEALLGGAVGGTVIRIGKGDRLLGSCPSKRAIGRHCLAAFLAKHSAKRNTIYVVPVDDGYWVAAVSSGALLPGSDVIVPSVDDARRTVAHYQALLDFLVYAPPAIDPGARPVTLESWLPAQSAKLKEFQIRPLDGKSGRSYGLVAAFLVVLIGTGYVLWRQTFSDSVPAANSGVDAALVRQRLDRMANQRLLEAMRQPLGERIYRDGMASLDRLGYARYGWRMKTVTIQNGSFTSMWDRTPVGNLEEMRRGIMAVFGESAVAVEPTKTLDQATVTVSYRPAEPVTLDLATIRASLPKDTEAIRHIVSEVQKVRGARFQVLETAPFIRPSQVPKQVTYRNPYVAKKVTVSGSQRHRLVQMLSSLNAVPYFRVDAIDLQFSDDGKVKQWVIRGQLYEKT